MILHLKHVLEYTYSEEVSLNPHYLYLSPKPTPYQQVFSQNLKVSPTPELTIKNMDQENNIQHVCFFNTKLKNLKVTSNIKIKSEAFNTLDFVFYPFESSKIPFSYKGNLGIYADYYLGKKNISFDVRAYAESIAEESNHNTIDFIMNIIKKIKADFQYISREMGEANPSYLTLITKEGTCRDFAVLMIDMCATKGIVARFVSGYLYGSELHRHELHAWVEVLLPGGGWRGFDPTEGKVVSENYVALASSLESQGLNPVRGTFRAFRNVESWLNTSVIIKNQKIT
jgi:transglutaminase-like putative cysteine protease